MERLTILFEDVAQRYAVSRLVLWIPGQTCFIDLCIANQHLFKNWKCPGLFCLFKNTLVMDVDRSLLFIEIPTSFVTKLCLERDTLYATSISSHHLQNARLAVRGLLSCVAD